MKKILKKEMRGRKLFTGIIIAVLFSNYGWAKDFEGSITMVKQSVYDTVYYTYYVSNGRIRIEEKDKSNEVKMVYIVNINKEEVYIINPSKKMYTKLKKITSDNQEQQQFIIKKTDNYKLINGVRCYQWRVKNIHRNTEITYWVAQKNFDFFDKMVKVLNKTDKSWEFFNNIPNAAGYFPMLYVERTLLRDEKMRTAVLKIEPHRIDSSIFQIPKDYMLFVM
jgi:hypothetical protein